MLYLQKTKLFNQFFFFLNLDNSYCLVFYMHYLEKLVHHKTEAIFHGLC